VGDKVPVNSPNIKLGQRTGLALKYKGPYEIVRKLDNGLDYIIRVWNAKNAKLFQIHIG
jgi:hypothetical protein